MKGGKISDITVCWCREEREREREGGRGRERNRQKEITVFIKLDKKTASADRLT